MRPSLYADDLMIVIGPEMTDNDRLLFDSDAAKALRRVLPRRCPNELCVEGTNQAVGYLCGDCDGRGWLYPDPPEGVSPAHWHAILVVVYRAMGILEED